MIKLGVNIDHVATLRQARYARVPHSLPYVEPDIVEAARAAIRGGADGITIHLREDRRHIVDHDVYDIRKQIDTRLNLEMAHWPEIITLALEIKPDSVCLVPEKRQEVTTEGGLNLLALSPDFEKMITTFRDHGIQVSLFIDPDPEQIARAPSSTPTWWSSTPDNTPPLKHRSKLRGNWANCAARAGSPMSADSSSMPGMESTIAISLHC